MRQGIFIDEENDLIIEDNAEIRENTAELLELSDYIVITAENGKAGFELAKKSYPDLILCDMMMPETNGACFLKLARENEIVRDIPLIFFSAGTLQPEAQQSLIAAADGFLKKPFSEEELLRTISGILK
jgi:CheY-like chemotaxis protein